MKVSTFICGLALVAVVPCATALRKVDPSASGIDCQQYTDCVSCTSAPSGQCGFCLFDKQCMKGTSQGPSRGVCGGTWEWSANLCGVQPSTPRPETPMPPATPQPLTPQPLNTPSPTAPSTLTKVASIPLNVSSSDEGGISMNMPADVYYTIQKNGTVVAVNVTSQSVAYTLGPFGDFGVIWTLATDDGHLLVAAGPDLPNKNCGGRFCSTPRLIRAYSPRGEFLHSFVAHDSSFRYKRGWRLHGNHMYYFQGGIQRLGPRSNFSYMNIATGEGRQLPSVLSLRSHFVFGSDRELAVSDGYSWKAVYDYRTQQMLINVTHPSLYDLWYVGSDASYYYFNRYLINSNRGSLQLYSKGTNLLAYNLTGGRYGSIGNSGLNTIPPLLHPDGQHLSFVSMPNNADDVRLTIVRLSSGEVVSTVSLWNSESSGGQPLQLVRGNLVVWTTTLKVVDYLSGTVVSESSTSCGGYCSLEPLGDSGLVLHWGSGSNNGYEAKVRSIFSGSQVWSHPFSDQAQWTQSVSKSVFVVTKKDPATVDVWKF